MVDNLGGYAEVVSSMEYEIAGEAVLCDSERIIFDNSLLPEEVHVGQSGSGEKVNVESMGA